MATPKKNPKDYLPRGQPTLYKPEYCDALITHMREGYSFESFAANISVNRDTLYTWTEVHPEFSDAKRAGKELSLKFYEGVAKMQALGQLRRVSREKPMIDSTGAVMYDDKGNVLMDKEYEPVTGSAATLIFMLKNMHGWRDKKDVNVGGQADAPPVKFKFSGLTKEQLQKRYDELITKAVKK